MGRRLLARSFLSGRCAMRRHDVWSSRAAVMVLPFGKRVRFTLCRRFDALGTPRRPAPLLDGMALREAAATCGNSRPTPRPHGTAATSTAGEGEAVPPESALPSRPGPARSCTHELVQAHFAASCRPAWQGPRRCRLHALARNGFGVHVACTQPEIRSRQHPELQRSGRRR